MFLDEQELPQRFAAHLDGWQKILCFMSSYLPKTKTCCLLWLGCEGWVLEDAGLAGTLPTGTDRSQHSAQIRGGGLQTITLPGGSLISSSPSNPSGSGCMWSTGEL